MYRIITSIYEKKKQKEFTQQLLFIMILSIQWMLFTPWLKKLTRF